MANAMTLQSLKISAAEQLLARMDAQALETAEILLNHSFDLMASLEDRASGHVVMFADAFNDLDDSLEDLSHSAV